MCMVLYLGTNAVLDTTAFSPEAPAVFVGAPQQEEAAVRTHLAAPHVYPVGSHQGCGCGFGFGEAYASDDIDPEEAESRRRLTTLLRSLVDAGHWAEVLVCWSGDEAEPLEEHSTVAPEAFLDPALVRERHHLVVTP